LSYRVIELNPTNPTNSKDPINLIIRRRITMKNLGKMLKQAQKMQSQMADVQKELSEKEITASSGGGMVTVTMNGAQEVLGIKINPEVINKDDAEMLEDLILTAIREATNKSKQMMQDEMGKITGGMDIPGL
jgi:DNA-binding YbaB/EbfC family protein